MENLEPIKEEALAILPEETMIINSMEDYTKAGDLLKLVKNKIKQIDEKRKEYTAPLETTKKKLIADFKDIAKPLEEFIDALSKVMISFNEIEQKRLDKEQAKIDADALKNLEDNKESVTEVPVVNDIKQARGNVAVTTIKKKWTFEILDEDKIPRNLCSSDSKKIRDAISKGIREVEGIKIYQESLISSR